MDSLLLRIFAQILPVVLALLTLSLDYYRVDKRTIAFKKLRKGLVFGTIIFLLFSILLTIGEYKHDKIENQERLDQIETERVNYERQIALLKETNGLAHRTISEVGSLLASAEDMNSSLEENTGKLIASYKTINSMITNQQGDLANNILTLNFRLDTHQKERLSEGDVMSIFSFSDREWQYQLTLAGYDKKRNKPLTADYPQRKESKFQRLISPSTYVDISKDLNYESTRKESYISVLFDQPSIVGLNNIKDAETVYLTVTSHINNGLNECNCFVQLSEVDIGLGGAEFKVEQMFPDSLYEIRSRLTIPLTISR